MITKSICYPKRSNCDIICPNDYLFDNPPLCATKSNINIDCYPAYLKCTADGRSQTSLERNNDPRNILLQIKMRSKQASAQAIAMAKQLIPIKTSKQNKLKAISLLTKSNFNNTSIDTNKKDYTIVIIIIIIIIIVLAKIFINR